MQNPLVRAKVGLVMPRSLQSISIIESKEERMQQQCAVRPIISYLPCAVAFTSTNYMCRTTYMNLKFTGDAIAVCGHPSRCHRHGDGRGKRGP